ncbi:MAG TPA: hypothetical protein VEY10_15400 [Flavisolibacter sp.]|nr:hypothetical protein [Flavisolibacter sp.]
MTQRPTIQKILASLLLVLFTISFIPKSFFHDAIANHTDEGTCNFSAEKLCIHQKGFSCSFNDLVVSSPYVAFSSVFNLVEQLIPAPHASRHKNFALELRFLGTESRGPPLSAA